ncbi:MAG: beta-ketoacyl-ACP synthase III [Acidimicrobiales bacterium]|jgi:3-oxoacyl-[acyl-carrier-protein] synthase-3|nr:beta-ketoacyl-ACP synthase III [Acidimicrobiales bacterium]MDP6298916.1 beta-ketoacyl-ACP synthase III [Acidimicrobiales bacterium]HJM27875.1 beta-ketoacyl-ACP synthase III [Acidimicrobiales bacterium]HJM98434.1 beta-ketoacyl-ACP synthase III [Acidimicrobiales bacterium]
MSIRTGNSEGKITGWGMALGPETITNDDLASRMDTSNEWILERTGISERRIGGTTAGLAVEAGQTALEMAGCNAKDIDLLILATTTPDDQIPATSGMVQHQLGLQCGAMDINAACSGFVYSLVTGFGFLKLGYKKILIIGSETLSRFTDWEDRSTAILFGDGAGAVVIEAQEGDGYLRGWDLNCEGSLRDILYAEVGGTIVMAGKEVFRKAVLAMTESAKSSMTAAGLSPSDISYVIPHQANIRIIESSMKRLGIAKDRAVSVLHKTGNNSSASIPIALFEALNDGRIKSGDILLLVGFGAGMTSASAVVQWGEANE